MADSDHFDIGIDVGGTFTDCVMIDAGGRSVVEKTFTTPRDPSEGVLAGLEKLAAKANAPLGEFLHRVRRIVHGTTITTNAVLTGNGVKTGFLTTQGFRDVLLMRRGVRENQFNSKVNPPPPLVPRSLTVSVPERVDCVGAETVPLDRERARRAIRELKEQGVESLAVSFLFSFLNPKHEAELAEIIKEEFPEAYVSLSTQVLPQLRAYERHSTTALNADDAGDGSAVCLPHAAFGTRRGAGRGDFLRRPRRTARCDRDGHGRHQLRRVAHQGG
jgi:N-methylhydantoinase A